MADINSSPDEELMMEYCRGSESAFLSLYNRFHGKLYGFLSLRLGQKKVHLLDELFQKTWLKVHIGRSSFDDTQKFSTWLFTIAMNNLRDEVGRASEKLPHDEVTDNLTSEVPSVEELFHRTHLLTRLKSAIWELPEMQREAILLIDSEGMPSKEAALIIGVSDAAIRQILFRGRHSLRKKFEAEELK